MSEGLSTSLASSLLLATMLGLKHGCDADHVAVVDGMTRARQLQGFWASRLVGAQFAVGHGAMVLFASLLFHSQSAPLPHWLDGVGIVISTLFLVIIGGSNLAHAVRASDGRVSPPRPVTAALVRLTGHKFHPVLVGMAFAFSFDAMAQAAFFAGRGSHIGAVAVVILAAAFSFGMILTDAAAGAMLNWFGNRTSRLAGQASRVFSGFIALTALATAAVGLVQELQIRDAAPSNDIGVWPGICLIVLTAVVYCALRIPQDRADNEQPLL